MGRNLLPGSLMLFRVGAIITPVFQRRKEVLYLLWNHIGGTDVIPVQVSHTQKTGTFSFLSMRWMVLVGRK